MHGKRQGKRPPIPRGHRSFDLADVQTPHRPLAAIQSEDFEGLTLGVRAFARALARLRAQYPEAPVDRLKDELWQFIERTDRNG